MKMKRLRGEVCILRNGTLACIVSKERAEAALKLLRDCYPQEKFEIQKEGEK